jgi:phage repressor protein C with HTH and peptisase S24 domain
MAVTPLQEKALSLIRDSAKSNYQIAKDTGISEATIGNYVNGKTKPTPANAKILIAYLNNMGSTHTGKSEQVEDVIYVPLLPICAQGGSLNDFVVSVKDSECEQVVSPIKGADFAITVSGESMFPEYPSGSQILIKRINEKAFIDWGKTYVLDTCNGTVIKRVFPSDSKDPHIIKCVSINPDYPPFEVGMNDVYGIYRVMMCMSVK